MNKIVICSAGPEIPLCQEIFPGIQTVVHDIKTWDISSSFCPDVSDLVLCCNVMMMSSDPKKWMTNLLTNTRYLLIQDSCFAKRYPDRELGNDGDSMRYSYEPLFKASLSEAYDLHNNDDSLIDITKHNIHDSIQFVALFRGFRE